MEELLTHKELPKKWIDRFENYTVGGFTSYDERDVEIHRQVQEIIDETVDEFGLTFTEVPTHIAVLKHGVRVSLLKRSIIAGSVFAPKTPDKYGIMDRGLRINRDIIDTVGMEKYKPTIMHELAHLEAVHVYDCRAECKDEHLEYCELLNASTSWQDAVNKFGLTKDEVRDINYIYQEKYE